MKVFTNGLPTTLFCWQPLIDKYRELRRTNPNSIDFTEMCNHARAIFVDSQNIKTGVPRFIYTNKTSESFINPYSHIFPQKPYTPQQSNSSQLSATTHNSDPTRLCTNCKKLGRICFTGHTEDECVQPGGGDEGNFAKLLSKKPNGARVMDQKGGGNWKGGEKEKANVIEEVLSHPTNNIKSANVVYASNPDTIFCYPGAYTEQFFMANEFTRNFSQECAAIGYDDNMTILDTGATSHIFHNRAIFQSYDTAQSCDIRTANCGILTSHAQGLVISNVNVEDDILKTVMKLGFRDSLHAPDVPVNIISVGRLTESKFHILFGPTMAKIFLPPRVDEEPFTRFIIASKIGRLFFLKTDFVYTTQILADKFPRILDQAMVSFPHVPVTADLWHRCLGHIGQDTTRGMIKQDYVTGINKLSKADHTHCVSCILGKFPSRSYPSRQNRASDHLELIHGDICGPFSVQTPGGYLYFLALLDDRSNFNYVGLLKKKSEAFDHFVTIQNCWELSTGCKIKRVRFDNALELVAAKLGTHFKALGISIEKSVPYSHQQNGKAERFIRTIEDGTMTLLVDAGQPMNMWGDAVLTKAYLNNLTPSSTLDINITPYETFNSKKPDASHLKVWGCECYVRIAKELRGKGTFKGFYATFIGYGQPLGQKGWAVRDSNGKYFTMDNAIFNENSNEPKSTLIEHNLDIDGPSIGNNVKRPPGGHVGVQPDRPIPYLKPRNTKCIPKLTEKGAAWEDGIIQCNKHIEGGCKDRSKQDDTLHLLGEWGCVAGKENVELLNDIRNYLDVDIINNNDTTELVQNYKSIIIHKECFNLQQPQHATRKRKPFLFIYNLSVPPISYKNALVCDNYPQWFSAMEEEIKGLEEKKVYEVTKLPPEKKGDISTLGICAQAK